MKKYFIVALMLLLSTAARAELLACTQMWCQEGMTVMFKDGVWPAGDYTFTVKLDDKTVTCKGSLPFKTCDGSVTCDAEGVTIGESGCAMGPETHSFHAVMTPVPPQHVTLDIARSDGKTFSFDSAVEAECGYPNGEQCDVHQCCSAVIETNVVWK